MAITREKLSGSTGGGGVSIILTAATGTVIHTSTTATNTVEEVHIWFTNTTTTPQPVTVEWGGTATINNIRKTIPGQDGLFLVAPGMHLMSGLAVRAFANTASVVIAYGFTNKITTG